MSTPHPTLEAKCWPEHEGPAPVEIVVQSDINRNISIKVEVQLPDGRRIIRRTTYDGHNDDSLADAERAALAKATSFVGALLAEILARRGQFGLRIAATPCSSCLQHPGPG